jgi:anti-sigma-K factor RskA
VVSWQSDLSNLDDAYTPENPPHGVKARIDARLFAEAARPAGGLWGSLVFWRGLAFASVAAAAAFGIYTSNLIRTCRPRRAAFARRRAGRSG